MEEALSYWVVLLVVWVCVFFAAFTGKLSLSTGNQIQLHEPLGWGGATIVATIATVLVFGVIWAVLDEDFHQMLYGELKSMARIDRD